MAAPLSAGAAGLITALTASANPVKINTDVTFTVKGTSGGCADILLDYGDGQTYKMISVSFDKNTNTTTPPHKYSVAKTYAVKATPGKSCAGAATLNLVVTSATGGGGGIGGGGGGFGNTGFDAPARDHVSLFPPRINTVFPLSVIRPGGGVIVQGATFGAQPGQLKIKLQNGQESNLGNLTWDNLHASGIIDPNLAGVLDQPATLRVVNARGFESNEVPVQFTARREVKFLPMEDVRFDCSSGSDKNGCNDYQSPTRPHSFMGHHSCTDLDVIFSCHDSGTDTYWATLANGWQLQSAQSWLGSWFGSTTPRSDPPVIVTDVPGSFKFTVYWDTQGNNNMNYKGAIYVEGPAGTSWK